jgi:hypothetical protein
MATTPLDERRYQPEDPATALHAAERRLQAAFAGLAFDPHMAHCPHCVDHFDMAPFGGDLPEVPLKDVARFVLKSGTTWGGPDDLRRLVPVLLPALADNQLPLDRAVVWHKLRWAGWPDWPNDETGAVNGYLLAEWNRLIRSEPRPAHAAHRWLVGAATVIDDLDPLLVAWHDALGPLTPPQHQAAAVGHLVALLTDSPLRPDLPNTVDDLFPHRPDTAAQVTAWLVGPGTAHELQRAVSVHAGTSSARRVGLADERLRRFRAAVGATPPE